MVKSMDKHIRYTTSFVGRQKDIAEIVALIKDEHCRLLTLLGPGGIGKTRLAIEAISYLEGSILGWHILC